MSSASSSGRSKKKSPLVAVVLAVLYPGLGHVYLRRWGRALLWFVAIIASVVWLVPPEAVPTTFSIDAILEARAAVPERVALVALVLSALSVLDAYWIAANSGTAQADTTSPVGEDGTQTCPNCGKEIDENLDFCHWCTTEFETSDGG
ncbi:zinc ribbon domain-containing protein [Salinibaculum rarum]|uniref:zinc ribbon domain-containing protein n=1 Tax=Salinibaculum rarum TaxID=3058903 RepID=UPI00265F398E|nr:zinc ribbon domain-containing protein [Salinibaculum sp. KK48]